MAGRGCSLRVASRPRHLGKTSEWTGDTRDGHRPPDPTDRDVALCAANGRTSGLPSVPSRPWTKAFKKTPHPNPGSSTQPITSPVLEPSAEFLFDLRLPGKEVAFTFSGVSH